MADLHVIEPEPLGRDIRECLEIAVNMAAADQMSSIAIAYVDREGVAGRIISDSPSQAALIGAIAILHGRMIEKALA